MKFLIPDFILKNYNSKKDSGSFYAFSMFIDISGFTNMTQNLMKNGKEGAEILSEMINDIFSPSIKKIYSHGGFITTFAGDAFTAVFPTNNFKMPLNAAIFTRDEFVKKGKISTKYGSFALSVKIGLSYGKINWQIITNNTQHAFYFMGEAINNCAKSEHQARSNEIIFDEHFKTNIEDESNLVYNKITEKYYILKNKTYDMQNEIEIIPLEYDQSKFIPQTILNSNFKGEFREIVSCFISFEKTPNLKENLSKMIDLSYRYGGYFNKIDFGDKGGIALVIFGAPIAQENLFNRACEFSLALSKMGNFPTRIGMTFGTVFTGFVGSPYRMEYTALGMVVNLSARFAMFARFGEILIDNPILENIKNDYSYEELGEKDFKGFSKPIKVFRLIKKISSHIKPAFKDKMTGRKQELDTLYKFVLPIFERKKSPGIIYIDGVAGIGKTRLIDALKQKIIKEKNLNDDDFVWLFMPCDEILKKSFNPIIYALQDYFSQSGDDDAYERKKSFEKKYSSIIRAIKDKNIKEDLQTAKSLIGGLLDLHWKNSIYEQLDAKNRYENTIYALKTFIQVQTIKASENNTVKRPVILEIDDAHWIDVDTKKWIETLVENISDHPITIIAGCRFLDNGSKFTFDTSDIPNKRIELTRFDNETAKLFIKRKLNMALNKKINDIDEKIFDLVIEKSEGNPFYIEQIILYLTEKQIIDGNGKLISKNISSIPTKINSIIVARIDRLTEDIKTTIKTASVLGKEFYLNILSKMLKTQNIINEEDNINKIITKCEKEDIIAHIKELKYVFKHALIRDTVYEIQLRQRLRKLHKLAAETINEIYKDNLDSHYDDLSYHYENAEEFNKAIYTLTKAIAFAKKNFRNNKALELTNKKISIYENHIDLKNEEYFQDYILTLLGKKYLLQLLGKIDEAEQIIDKIKKSAENISNLEILARIQLDYANLLKFKGKFSQSLEYLNSAYSLFKKINHKEMLGLVHLDLGIVNFRLGNIDNAFEHFNSELEIFKELNIKSKIAEAYGNLGVMYRYVGNFEKAMYYLNKQMEIARILNDKIQLARIYSNIGWVNEGLNNFNEAIKYYRDAIEINQKLGLKLEVTRILDNMGFLYQELGNPNEAIIYHNKAQKIAKQTNDIESLINIYANLGHAYKNLQQFEKAIENYNLGIDLSLKNTLNYPLPELYIGIGEVYFLMKNHNKAKEFIDMGMDIATKLNDQVYLKKAKEILDKIRRSKNEI